MNNDPTFYIYSKPYFDIFNQLACYVVVNSTKSKIKKLLLLNEDSESPIVFSFEKRLGINVL